MNRASAMRPLSSPAWFILMFALLLPATPLVAADSPAAVTADMLNARLKEVEAATSLDETTRTSLLDLLNNALGKLETDRANRATAQKYIETVKTAPQEAQKIRKQLERDKQRQDAVAITATQNSPFDEIERELLQEKANLAAVKAKLDDLEAQLRAGNTRSASIQKQLLAAEQSKEELETQLKLPPPAGELPWLTEARLWSQKTGIAARRSEIAMLDQELLSMPMRVDLLEAQRDQAPAHCRPGGPACCHAREAVKTAVAGGSRTGGSGSRGRGL